MKLPVMLVSVAAWAFWVRTQISSYDRLVLDNEILHYLITF